MKRKPHKKRKRDPPSKLLNAAENFWIDSLENLEFVGQLGQGGFGNVLLYNNRQTGQHFAIKIQDAANQAMFDKETLLLRTAQGSSFVTKLCGAFATKECLCMVLEFLPGGDLEKLIMRCGKLEERAVRFYACEIICGIQYLHQLGIIHRDLKLENTLINAHGHVRVGDLGLATLSNGEKQHDICGTCYYRAPEMLEEQSYDESVDWWALGVMLYRLLTGTFLERTPQLRLGYQKGCLPSPMHEPFFSDVEWGKIFNEELNPPFVPLLQSVDPFADESSLSNFNIPGLSYFPPID
ncbi:protein kinase C eta type-like [Acropora palmata]|uniref:protein kinase C eta type-like n=1 Tax=Acropora palmata TaxID=6131 RepID=UPI003DA1A4CE